MDNIDGKQMSISDTLNMKRNELRQELEKREQQLKEKFIQKVKDKETELKEAEKQVKKIKSIFSRSSIRTILD
jgi:septin 6/8/11